MDDGYKVAFYLTVGAIVKIWLKNHFTLLFRLNILFSITRQKQKAHHAEAKEKKKSQTAEVSDIVAIHDYIICEFCPGLN